MTDEFQRWCGWMRRVKQYLTDLRRDIKDPVRRRAFIEWELENLARDIESAVRRGAISEALDLRYFAQRLRAA